MVCCEIIVQSRLIRPSLACIRCTHGRTHEGASRQAVLCPGCDGPRAVDGDHDPVFRLDVDHLDVQNAFVDLNLPLGDDADLTLRGGRQELLFGAQRLVSPLDWANTRRTFDGASAILSMGDWKHTLFWTHPVLIDNDSKNWDAWANQVWPSIYQIDEAGFVRYWWYGELEFQGRGGNGWMRKRINELQQENP